MNNRPSIYSNPPQEEHLWKLWRFGDRRYLSGEYHSRAEAEKGQRTIARLFPQSQFEIEFTGKFLNMESKNGGF